MTWQDIPGRHAMGWILEAAIHRTPKGGAWVEVGVALGKGVARMAHVLHEAGRDDVRIYAVDPWGGYARNGEQQDSGEPSEHGDWALFLDTMQKHAPDALRRLHIIRETSFSAGLAVEPGPLHLVILDGDHSYAAVKTDIEMWAPFIESGGIIGGDDYHHEEHPGVVQAVDEAFGIRVMTGNEDGWPTWMVGL